MVTGAALLWWRDNKEGRPAVAIAPTKDGLSIGLGGGF
jgi:hypothetical protein